MNNNVRPFSLAMGMLVLGLGGCGTAPDTEWLTEDSTPGSRSDSIVNGNYEYVAGTGTVLNIRGASLGTCTGTLIAPRTVLTAAHCVVDSSYDEPEDGAYLFYNGDGVASDVEDLNPVLKTFVHPDYVPRDEYGAPEIELVYDGEEAGAFAVSQSDLAILQLTRVESGSFVQLANQTPIAGLPVKLVGRGTTDLYADDSDWMRSAKNTIEWVGEPGFYVFGASGDEGNLCSGDSGGPTLNMAGELLGVHSLGTCYLTMTTGWWIFAKEIDISLGFDARIDTAMEWISDHTVSAAVSKPKIDIVGLTEELPKGATRDLDFAVQVEAEGRLRRLEVLLDNQPVFDQDFAFTDHPDKEFSLVSTFSGDNPHLLEAIATDWAGQTSEASVVVRRNAESNLHDHGSGSGSGCNATPSSPSLLIFLLLLIFLGRTKHLKQHFEKRFDTHSFCN